MYYSGCGPAIQPVETVAVLHMFLGAVTGIADDGHAHHRDCNDFDDFDSSNEEELIVSHADTPTNISKSLPHSIIGIDGVDRDTT